MPRKIILDSSNTLGVWIQKQNAMSDYMGDLDDFDSSIRANDPSGVNHWNQPTVYQNPGDSNFVTALNGTYDPRVSTLVAATTYTNPPTARLIGFTSPLFVDSATFKKIDIDHLFAHDPEVRDSYEDGDSIGATGLPVASFLYDLHVADSALFTTISAPTIDTTALDSAIFDNIMLDSGATMQVDTLDYDSDEKVVFHNLRLDELPGAVDSAKFGTLNTENITAESAYIGVAIIDSAIINNNIYFMGKTFDGVSLIQIVDKNGANLLAGYKLDSV